MSPFPVLIRTSSPGGETRFSLGDPLADSYLAFVAGRARRGGPYDTCTGKKQDSGPST